MEYKHFPSIGCKRGVVVAVLIILNGKTNCRNVKYTFFFLNNTYTLLRKLPIIFNYLNQNLNLLGLPT